VPECREGDGNSSDCGPNNTCWMGYTCIQGHWVTTTCNDPGCQGTSSSSSSGAGGAGGAQPDAGGGGAGGGDAGGALPDAGADADAAD